MATQNNNQAINLVNIESLINSHDVRLKTLDDELKIEKDMFNGLLENDEEYLLADKEAKKTAKLKSQAKAKVMSRTEAKAVVEKIKDLQNQMKELKVALSDYLSQYVTLSGTNQIESPDGTMREILYTARLVKKLG